MNRLVGRRRGTVQRRFGRRRVEAVEEARRCRRRLGDGRVAGRHVDDDPPDGVDVVDGLGGRDDAMGVDGIERWLPRRRRSLHRRRMPDRCTGSRRVRPGLPTPGGHDRIGRRRWRQTQTRWGQRRIARRRQAQTRWGQRRIGRRRQTQTRRRQRRIARRQPETRWGQRRIGRRRWRQTQTRRRQRQSRRGQRRRVSGGGRRRHGGLPGRPARWDSRTGRLREVGAVGRQDRGADPTTPHTLFVARSALGTTELGLLVPRHRRSLSKLRGRSGASSHVSRHERSSSAFPRSRSSYFSTLPVAFRGRASTKRTCRGTL